MKHIKRVDFCSQQRKIAKWQRKQKCIAIIIIFCFSSFSLSFYGTTKRDNLGSHLEIFCFHRKNNNSNSPKKLYKFESDYVYKYYCKFMQFRTRKWKKKCVFQSHISIFICPFLPTTAAYHTIHLYLYIFSIGNIGIMVFFSSIPYFQTHLFLSNNFFLPAFETFFFFLFPYSFRVHSFFLLVSILCICFVCYH